jgi:hypothetical protein
LSGPACASGGGSDQVAQEAAEHDGRGCGLARALQPAHQIAVAAGLDTKVTGDAAEAVLQYGLIDECPQVFAGRGAVQPAAWTVVVGAAAESVGGGGDRGDVHPREVRTARHDSLQPPVRQLDEGNLRQLAGPDGRHHLRGAALLPCGYVGIHAL